MKNKVIGIGLLSLSIGFYACQKEELQNPTKTKEEGTETFMSKEKKMVNGQMVDFNNGESGCSAGPAICVPFCCVTPSIIQGYNTAIDNGTANTFLTPSVIDYLSDDDNFVREAMDAVASGSMEVSYVSMSNKVFYFYGSDNPTPADYEVAHVIEKE